MTVGAGQPCYSPSVFLLSLPLFLSSSTLSFCLLATLSLPTFSLSPSLKAVGGLRFVHYSSNGELEDVTTACLDEQEIM